MNQSPCLASRSLGVACVLFALAHVGLTPEVARAEGRGAGPPTQSAKPAVRRMPGWAKTALVAGSALIVAHQGLLALQVAETDKVETKQTAVALAWSPVQGQLQRRADALHSIARGGEFAGVLPADSVPNVATPRSYGAN